MSRRAVVPLLSLGLDPAAEQPLFRQLYGQLREAILAGRLGGGQRLPSSRLLAGELGCSRNTVLGALDQLLAEGYLEGRRGSGTYVSSVLPDELLTARRGPAASSS
ncbi:MAG: winged helix-turn-helix domain-containing protein, partial [Tistlia sp.]